MSNSQAKTKHQFARAVAERSGMSAADVQCVLDALAQVVLEELATDGPGAVTIAGLVKAEVLPRAARPERVGRNPATGDPVRIAAQPARTRGKIRLRPLKRLRDVL